MKITKRQLKQIIAEEKQRLQEELALPNHTIFSDASLFNVLSEEVEDYLDMVATAREGMTIEELEVMKQALMQAFSEIERQYSPLR